MPAPRQLLLAAASLALSSSSGHPNPCFDESLANGPNAANPAVTADGWTQGRATFYDGPSSFLEVPSC